MEAEQPLRFQKGLGEPREPRPVDRKIRPILEPGMDDPAGKMPVDIEAVFQLSPFVHRQGLDDLKDDRRDVERLAVRLKRQASENQSESSDSSAVENATGPS